MKIRVLFVVTALLALLCASVAFAQSAPKTVIHVINVKWKAEATPAQIQAALDAAQALPKAYPGILHVWTKNIKYQGQEGMKQAIIMEFKDEESLKKYADSPAQKAFYDKYLAIRDQSRTHDVTN
jgi:antibiotic biosynthesis monooxygenase (ABM) superfamily enzyme